MKPKPNWISQEECLNRGGHFWNHYDSHQPVDDYGRAEPGIRYIMGGQPVQFRKCGLCGLNQRLEPSKWVEVPNE